MFNKNTSIITLIALALLVGCGDTNKVKVQTKKEKFWLKDESKEKVSGYCSIYSGYLLRLLIGRGRSAWRLYQIAEDAESVCGAAFDKRYINFFDNHLSHTTSNSLITLRSKSKSASFPLWRIYKIGSIKVNTMFDKSAATFDIILDNQCIYRALYSDSDLAKKEKEKLESTYEAYFSTHNVSIKLEHPKDETIYSPYKSCF